jgi:hypothetical protein
VLGERLELVDTAVLNLFADLERGNGAGAPHKDAREVLAVAVPMVNSIGTVALGTLSCP